MIEVSVLFRSGSSLSFICEDIKFQLNEENRVVAYNITGIKKSYLSPMYLNIAEIDAVSTRTLDEREVATIEQ